MTISSTGNASIDSIRDAYKSEADKAGETSDALGKDDFLTMLVAQLENQDPLNPMDGTDFSAQLAQFSQLEQLMNLNASMTTLASSFSTESQKDMMSYIGKQVSGNVDSMQVENGGVSGGFFSLAQNADIIVNISDSSGKTIKTLYQGGKPPGAHLIEWDGTDADGDAVVDGTYKYSVLANTGSGYQEMPTSVTGVVDGIAYSNEIPYLVVQGILLDPDSLTSVSDVDGSGLPQDSILSYLGKTISSNQPIISVKDGVVSGEDLKFDLKENEAATIRIYDPWDNLVQTIVVNDAVEGENLENWNAVGSDGHGVPEGLYYYTVETGSGTGTISVSEEVSGIEYANGSQYLVLKDSGRLVAISSITAIN
ncbi:MAG: flagellar hook capping protein [Desulfobacteraceae bacterium]|nr:flagellar hook capping protein [Desulfobacteraceae bacterium]